MSYEGAGSEKQEAPEYRVVGSIHRIELLPASIPKVAPRFPVADYVAAVRVCNSCLDAGVITGNTDVLISAVALRRGMEIFTTDKDFNLIARVVPIKLFEASP